MFMLMTLLTCYMSGHAIPGVIRLRNHVVLHIRTILTEALVHARLEICIWWELGAAASMSRPEVDVHYNYRSPDSGD